MDKGERERWSKLSAHAQTLATHLARYLERGARKVSVNDLRTWIPDSRLLVQLMRELESRAYGHLDQSDPANPIFMMDIPMFQTLQQSGRIVT